MKITNKYNLPESFVRFSEDNKLTKDGTIRVTELIGPPKIRSLTKKHYEEIEVDASDQIWALLGTSVHFILENYTDDKEFKEEPLRVKFDKVTLKGRPDLLSRDGILSDYKVTSVWSFIYGDKPEWERQLNVYRWMYHKANMMDETIHERHSYPDVRELEIVAILRDWSQMKALEADYPKIPVVKIKIPLWDLDFTEAYIKERLKIHAEETPRDCSKEERWAKDDSFAVKKRGATRATRVFSSLSEAEQLIKDATVDYELENRPGESVRCQRYCKVLKWCEQGRALVK